MACADHALLARENILAGALVLVLAWAGPTGGAEVYSFDADSFARKNLEVGGFIEGRAAHMDVRQGSALARLNLYDDPQSTLDELAGRLRLNGAASRGPASVHWQLDAAGQSDHEGWQDAAEIYETYLRLAPSSTLTGTAGKKSFKWGKGYAWNPVGFLNRPKDPNDPEEAMEGFVVAEAETIRSLEGDLRNVALTVAALPVWQGVNADFGARDNLNLAGKLTLLYWDTDIDLLAYTGNSRTSRLGIDFSRNLRTNFEIHGELAYVPEMEQLLPDSAGSWFRDSGSSFSWLAGLRYLSAFDLTTIVEYYHNGAGFSEEEMSRFTRLIDAGYEHWTRSGDDTLLRRLGQQGARGFLRPNPGRDYLYARLSLKEPFDILSCTPALTTIVNLADHSYSLTPEIIYTGWTNWEVRLRLAVPNGGEASEFGEKQNSNRLEVRLRSFF